MSDKHGLPTGKHTLVEEGTEFKGTMSSSCPIVVMGKVEGDVTGPVIHITPSGVVAGVGEGQGAALRPASWPARSRPRPSRSPVRSAIAR